MPHSSTCLRRWSRLRIISGVIFMLSLGCPKQSKAVAQNATRETKTDPFPRIKQTFLTRFLKLCQTNSFPSKILLTVVGSTDKDPTTSGVLYSALLLNLPKDKGNLNPVPSKRFNS